MKNKNGQIKRKIGGAGLFHQAVLMSGSALSPCALASDPRSLKEQVSRQMDCPKSATPDADIGDCLRKKPLASLLGVHVETPRFWPTFAPFIDGSIIEMDPLLAMQSGSQSFKNYALMAGVTSVESYRHARQANQLFIKVIINHSFFLYTLFHYLRIN